MRLSQSDPFYVCLNFNVVETSASAEFNATLNCFHTFLFNFSYCSSCSFKCGGTYRDDSYLRLNEKYLMTL